MGQVQGNAHSPRRLECRLPLGRRSKVGYNRQVDCIKANLKEPLRQLNAQSLKRDGLQSQGVPASSRVLCWVCWEGHLWVNCWRGAHFLRIYDRTFHFQLLCLMTGKPCLHSTPQGLGHLPIEKSLKVERRRGLGSLWDGMRPESTGWTDWLALGSCPFQGYESLSSWKGWSESWWCQFNGSQLGVSPFLEGLATALLPLWLGRKLSQGWLSNQGISLRSGGKC